MCALEELVISKGPCDKPNTNYVDAWPYVQYYFGEKDEEKRKNGIGEHHWSGTQSLEWYTGNFLRDTMHGPGNYRSKCRGPNHLAHTYEGAFYNNMMHGYGTMSYCDGRVFTGLYHDNIRWGPGIESFAAREQNVGLWRGTRLVRLAWRPQAPDVALDMNTTLVGTAVVAKHRLMLKECITTIGDTNSAIELLKQHGADPLKAVEKWRKLYPPHCTDTASPLCYTDEFDNVYYKGEIHSLELLKKPEISASSSAEVKIDDNNKLKTQKIYYAWNNNDIIVHMMKHCYKHEMQRNDLKLNLKTIIAGPRKEFRLPGKHEIDCRTLLVACYLGDINKVAPLITECNVDPNLTDALGNSALMYAACGDRSEVISFLLEAGAKVDYWNDSCCTPLGVTLLRYACSRRDVSPSGMSKAIMPTLASVPTEANKGVVEWNISRDPQPFTKASTLPINTSKQFLKSTGITPHKKNRSHTILKDTSFTKKKTDAVKIQEHYSELLTQEQNLYEQLIEEYTTKVFTLFSTPANSPVPYIFDVQDMAQAVDLIVQEEEDKRRTEKIDYKKQLAPQIGGDVKLSLYSVKQSKVTLAQSLEKPFGLFSSEYLKTERELQMMLIIEQLLHEGADPHRVRCPQSALFVAIVSGNPDLVDILIKHGANVNEVCDQTLGYGTVDVAISNGSLTQEKIRLIRVLLENGARVNYRLPTPKSSSNIEITPGPTLLHYVLSKIITTGEQCQELLELLLDYGCDPLVQYKGSSAIDIALSKRLDLLYLFYTAPITDLNKIINDDNQTVLVKMFYMPFFKTMRNEERLPALTNLLLYGADPLIKCQNFDDECDNLFVFTKEVLLSFEPRYSEKMSPTEVKGKEEGKGKKVKSDPKMKKHEKGGKDTKKQEKSVSIAKTKAALEGRADYQQAVDLVVDCARILYIRWIQASLMTKIVKLVDKYKQRHWNIIIKDFKNKKATGLWLSPSRCLEIWDIFKTTRNTIYNDRTVLRYVMCIASYCNKKANRMLLDPKLLYEEKLTIEKEVVKAIHEHKMSMSHDIISSKKQYVTPELNTNVEKFNICFECAFPFTEDKIICSSCKLIAFCSMDCMEINVRRINCHPCSDYLKDKYFPTIEEGYDIGTGIDLGFL